MPTTEWLESVQDNIDERMPGAIVAREGSELAHRLRQRGWVARLGWKSGSGGERPIWFLRFEQPDESAIHDA
jgi:hypothetical protein